MVKRDLSTVFSKKVRYGHIRIFHYFIELNGRKKRLGMTKS